MTRMPRPRKPYIQKEVTRHGKTVWYFRRGKGKRIRLSGTFGSAEFNRSYDAALSGAEIAPQPKVSQRSLRWLVDRYFESGRFVLLSKETQAMRRRVLDAVCKTGGNLDFTLLTTKDIRAGKVRREATPYAAVNYVKIMRVLFEFAVDSGWIDQNPAIGVDSTPPPTAGHHTWSVEEIAQYQAKYPLGTQERLAMDVLLYTGMRRGDAVLLGKQHIKDGYISFRASKTRNEITIPLLQPLAESIQATQTGDLALLVTSQGKPWTKEAFGNWFAKACEAADLKGRAHGLRKAGATLAAEGGASAFALSAMYGWSNTRMAEVYTKKADRKLLAEQAATALSPHLVKGKGKTAK